MAKEVAKKDKKPKGTMPQRAWAVVKKEAAHYWAGTKLLGHEIKISAKLIRVVLRGETLTRRERRQVSPQIRFHDDGCLQVASTNNGRSAPFDSILRLLGRPLHGTLVTCRTQTIPQHAA